jgi:hypothetical protein
MPYASRSSVEIGRAPTSTSDPDGVSSNNRNVSSSRSLEATIVIARKPGASTTSLRTSTLFCGPSS